ncbi:MAG: hypothetical protein JWM32_2020 [Verrucomicrobia bacterium]|nr:hypothetical protein [Verrucomicrobiota bacterium]
MLGKSQFASIPEKAVFLNIPYGPAREKCLVALTAALIATGRIPCLTFQVPDGGQGRLQRIFTLLKSCSVSVHDLSAVGIPVRFNMPFELGLACAIREQSGKHEFLLLERIPHRLQRNLSDLGGIDPIIHGGSVRGTICAVLESLSHPAGNPSTTEVYKLYRSMIQILPAIKNEHGNQSLFSSRVYTILFLVGCETGRKMGLNSSLIFPQIPEIRAKFCSLVSPVPVFSSGNPAQSRTRI